MGLQALIFDVDGTLAETAEIHRAAFNQAFEEFNTGWCWNRATYSYLMHMPKDADMLEAYNAISTSKNLQHTLLPDMLGQIALRKKQVYLSMLAGGAAYLRPGVCRLMDEARRDGVALGIVSTRSRIEFEILVTNTLGFDALGMFDTIRTSEDCQQNALTAYRYVIADLAINPAKSVAIDDTESGIRHAVICGLKTIATPGIYTSSGRFDAAEIVVSDLGQPAEPFDVILGNAHGTGYITSGFLQQMVGSNLVAA
ncbi:MAG: HAD hydrolase-like protein [Rhodobacteraceae bacterium]|nr:HAD hydrolase-like protein [Paracoccaceae bacterium]